MENKILELLIDMQNDIKDIKVDLYQVKEELKLFKDETEANFELTTNNIFIVEKRTQNLDIKLKQINKIHHQ